VDVDPWLVVEEFTEECSLEEEPLDWEDEGDEVMPLQDARVRISEAITTCE